MAYLSYCIQYNEFNKNDSNNNKDNNYHHNSFGFSLV